MGLQPRALANITCGHTVRLLVYSRMTPNPQNWLTLFHSSSRHRFVLEKNRLPGRTNYPLGANGRSICAC